MTIALTPIQEMLLSAIRSSGAEGIAIDRSNSDLARVLVHHELASVTGPTDAERLVITARGASFLTRTAA